jgi:hypothetical protein
MSWSDTPSSSDEAQQANGWSDSSDTDGALGAAALAIIPAAEAPRRRRGRPRKIRRLCDNSEVEEALAIPEQPVWFGFARPIGGDLFHLCSAALAQPAGSPNESVLKVTVDSDIGTRFIFQCGRCFQH